MIVLGVSFFLNTHISRENLFSTIKKNIRRVADDFSSQSKDTCRIGQGVCLILPLVFPAFAAVLLIACSSQMCTTMEGVEMLFPSRVTSFDGWSSWFSPAKQIKNR